ncbi:MAG: hypothetical protein AB1640_05490 [bacterium]
MSKRAVFAVIPLLVFAFVASQAMAEMTSESERATSATQAQGAMKTYRASEVMQKDVKDTRGEKLGSVEDIALGQHGQGYVIISRADNSDQLVPVPFSAIQFQTESKEGAQHAKVKHLVLNIDKNRFASAPAFNKDNWPDLARSDWSQRVRGYYGSSQEGQWGQMEHQMEHQGQMEHEGSSSGRTETGRDAESRSY